MKNIAPDSIYHSKTFDFWWTLSGVLCRKGDEKFLVGRPKGFLPNFNVVHIDAMIVVYQKSKKNYYFLSILYGMLNTMSSKSCCLLTAGDHA